MSCYDLDVIKSIIKIEGKIVNETPLRIGTGKVQEFEEPTDNPVIKTNGVPLIPGSTLKGALRSLAEAYVKGWNNDKYPVIDLDADEKRNPSCLKEGTTEYYCIPCILFGFKDLSSRVYILDAVAEQGFTISQRTMVTIHRVFGGQYPRHLYTLDFVNPGAKFNFNIYIYNLNIIKGENEEWKIKAIEVMKYLLRTLTEEGIFIGSKKSAGFGLIRLTEGKVYLYERPEFTKQEFDLKVVTQ